MAPHESRSDPVVRLRAVETADLALFFEHQADPVASTMAGFPSRDRAAFDAHWANEVLADPTGRVFTITADGRVAGNVVAWGTPEERLVGYWLGRDVWGRGVATCALAAFLDLETTRPLFAHVAVHNHGSIRVLAKCGFVETSARDGDERVWRLDR